MLSDFVNVIFDQRDFCDIYDTFNVFSGERTHPFWEWCVPLNNNVANQG